MFGDDYEFIEDLVNLVLDSSITIGVYDNTSISETEFISGYNDNTWVATRTNTMTSEYEQVDSEPVYEYNEETEENELVGYEPVYDWVDYEPEIGEWSHDISTVHNYKIEYNKYYSDLIEIQLTNLDIWVMKYDVEYSYIDSGETNSGLVDYDFERQSDKDGKFVSLESLTSQYSPSENWGDIEWTSVDSDTRIKTQTETRSQSNSNQYFNSSAGNFNSKKYVKEGNPEVREKTNKFAKKGDWDYPNFCTIYLDAKLARSNIADIESWLFEILENNESTVDMVDLTKYLFYCALDKDYGVTEYTFTVYTSNSFRVTGLSSSLASYLRQFSHTGEAPQSADGKYYLMYGDGVGWPTIGNADLQWKSHYYKFNVSGKVLKNGEEQEVDNITEYVNSFLTRGVDAEYTDAEIYDMQIYIEKSIVDEIGDQVQAVYFDSVKNTVASAGIDLSMQQLYALTAIQYNFGHLPERNGYSFNEVYLAASALYEVNSWEHCKFIWDNWWCYLGGGASGHIPARDAAFETYVKGVYNFSESNAGEVFTRGYYIYYTQDQLNNFSYAPKKTITRNSSNEEEIFTYSGVVQQDSLLGYAEIIHKQMEQYKYTYSLQTTDSHRLPNTSDEAWELRTCCCATYVDWVLIEAGYQESHSLIHSSTALFNTYKDYFEVVESYDDLQPGDIIFMSSSSNSTVNYNGKTLSIGHTQIYAGNDSWYNAGSTNAMQRESPYVWASARDSFQIALRVVN